MAIPGEFLCVGSHFSATAKAAFVPVGCDEPAQSPSIDDAAVVGFVLASIYPELNNSRDWEEAQKSG